VVIEDSRKHPRRLCHKPLFITHKYRHLTGVATNISRGGVFVETARNISFGERISLIIHGSKHTKGVRLKGWIVRLDPNGVGVSFNRRADRERRYDLDRRTGLDRRKIAKRRPQ